MTKYFGELESGEWLMKKRLKEKRKTETQQPL